jgi:hypothetical protein
MKEEHYKDLRDDCPISYDPTVKPTTKDLAEAERRSQEFVKLMEAKEKERMNENDTKTVTIMKYQAKDGNYEWEVKDKFDIADPVERLDAMNALRDEMLASGEMKKHLWTKETVLF